MPDKLKVAVIGNGTIGTVHADRYSRCPQVELGWVVDILPDRARTLAAAHGVPNVSADYHDALKDPTVGAVSVCLPNYLHCPVTIDALQAGKHVLCEKPIALSLDEAQRMQAAAKKANRQLAIGVVNRFNDYVNLVKHAIDGGELGQVYHVSFTFKAYRSIPGLGGWFTTKSKSGGGVMIDWGIHFLDLVLYCIGFPNPLSISGVAHGRLGASMKDYTYLSMWATPDPSGVYDVEEYASGVVRTSGPTISFEGAWAQNVDAPSMFIDFLGDKGGIRLAYGQSFTQYSFKGGALFETKSQKTPSDHFLNEMSSFADCCLSGRKSPAHIDTVIVSQRIIDGFYQSVKAGAEVKL